MGKKITRMLWNNREFVILSPPFIVLQPCSFLYSDGFLAILVKIMRDSLCVVKACASEVGTENVFYRHSIANFFSDDIITAIKSSVSISEVLAITAHTC